MDWEGRNTAVLVWRWHDSLWRKSERVDKKKLLTNSTPQNGILKGINLTKYLQDLYKEKYKSLMTEIKELNKWRGIYVRG